MFVTFGKIDIVVPSWQWWAEALTWYGENFFRGVSRYGASQVDQHVQVPETIYSDTQREYLVRLYKSTQFGDTYTESVSQQPKALDEFSFSDGTNYSYDPAKYVNKSPLFVTFGKESNANTTDFQDTDIDFATDTIKLIKHGFVSYDKVTFSNPETLPSPLVAGTVYYVSKVDDDQFRLYSDAALTTLVNLAPRSSLTFNDTNVDSASNRLTLTAHGLTTGQLVRFTTTGTLPGGLTSDTKYYVNVIDANTVELYLDKAQTRIVNIAPRAERSVLSSDFNDPNDWVTVNSHLLFDKTPIRWRAGFGTLPAGLTAGTVYYVRAYSANIFSLYTDVNLTTKVTNFAGASDTVWFYEDGGTHTLTVDGGTHTIKRQSFDSVYFARLRQLKFNKTGDNWRGVSPSNLYVSVDGQLVPRHTLASPGNATYNSYYVYATASGSPLLGSGTAKYLAFTSSTQIGIDRAAIVRMVNTETKWCGSAATNTAWNYDNGSWVPAYGLGLYADYFNGRFPTCGAVFQGRLVLSGFEHDDLTMLFSNVSDTIYAGEFFNYYQVTDDNSQPSTDPFDVVVSGNASESVVALLAYQNSLFCFTQDAVYRTFSQTINVNIDNRSIGPVSNQGSCNAQCVVTTENTVLFLSPNGLFDLNTVMQEQYQAAEVSTKVRSLFSVLKQKTYRNLPWVVYDKVNYKVYMALPIQGDTTQCQQIFVYDTQRQAWTQYDTYQKFKSYAGVFYSDATLGYQVGISNRLLCSNVLTRFGYSRRADFVTRVTNQSAPINGVPRTFWTTQTLSGVYEYKPDFPLLPFTDVNDIVVYYGSTLNGVVLTTQWDKTPNGYIRLRFNPTDNYYLLVEPVTQWLIWKNNLPYTLEGGDFKNRTYADACTPIGGGGGGYG